MKESEHRLTNGKHRWKNVRRIHVVRDKAEGRRDMKKSWKGKGKPHAKRAEDWVVTETLLVVYMQDSTGSCAYG